MFIFQWIIFEGPKCSLNCLIAIHMVPCLLSFAFTSEGFRIMHILV